MPNLKNSLTFLAILFAVFGSYFVYTRGPDTESYLDKYPAISKLDRSIFKVHDTISYLEGRYLDLIKYSGDKIATIFNESTKSGPDAVLVVNAITPVKVAENSSEISADTQTASLINFASENFGFVEKRVLDPIYDQVYKFSLALSLTIYSIGNDVLTFSEKGIVGMSIGWEYLTRVPDKATTFTYLQVNNFSSGLAKLIYNTGNRVLSFAGRGILGISIFSDSMNDLADDLLGQDGPVSIGDKGADFVGSKIFGFSAGLANLVYDAGNGILAFSQRGILGISLLSDSVSDLAHQAPVPKDFASLGEEAFDFAYDQALRFSTNVAKAIYQTGEEVLTFSQRGIVGMAVASNNFTEISGRFGNYLYTKAYDFSFGIARIIYRTGNSVLIFSERGVFGAGAVVANVYNSIGNSLVASYGFTGELAFKGTKVADQVSGWFGSVSENTEQILREGNVSMSAFVLASSDDNIKQYLKRRLSEMSLDLKKTWSGFKTKVGNLAKNTNLNLVYYSNADNYNYLWNRPKSNQSVDTKKLQITAKSSDSDESLGVAIVPKTGNVVDDASIKQQIRDSFSDKVEVIADESGTSGVVKPIFKNRQGEDYIYVLVPIKK